MHGYDHPWAGGAGKNLLQYPYHHTTKTDHGITYTDKGDGELILSGTADGQSTFYLEYFGTKDYSLLAGKTLITTCEEGVSGLQINFYSSETGVVNLFANQPSQYTFPATATTWNIVINIANGTAITTPITIKPMIRLSSIADATWLPYSNICPISGRTGTSVASVPKAEYAPFFEGVKNGTYGFVDLGSLNWIAEQGYSSYLRMFSTDIQSLIKKPLSGDSVANMICAIYDAVSSNATYVGTEGISIQTTGNIAIYDSDYTDAATFKTAMNGVYLIYELATPTTPSYTQAQWDALVNSFNSASVTLSFGQTVYGGQVDFKTGIVTVEWGYIASYNGETLPSEWISDLDTYAAGTTPTTGAEVAYELATPTELTLSPAELTMLKGYNYLSGDGVIDITALVSDTWPLEEVTDNES